MPTWLTVVIIVVAVAVIGTVIWLAAQEMQRKRLRRRFGPEYDRAVEQADNPRAAQRELADRERRHRELDIHPLSPSARERYSQQWALVQEKFVDQPSAAVAEADRVLVALMAERGYPTEGFEQQAADLSVRHARTLEHYRAAHDTQHSRTAASTEDLRDAMVHYRTVFEDLLTDSADKADDGDRKHNGHDPQREASAHQRTERNGGR
jgi:hypothetical protein